MIYGQNWADENRDRKNELHRLWCQANPERRKAHKSKKIRPETKRAWHLANIEKVRASYRRYYERNKGYFKTKCRNRYAMHASAEGTHTEEDVADLLTAQRGKCAYCRTSFGPKYHVDHIVALSRGGSNDRANLQILCSFCNLSKGAKHPGDFARERGLLL